MWPALRPSAATALRACAAHPVARLTSRVTFPKGRSLAVRSYRITLPIRTFATERTKPPTATKAKKKTTKKKPAKKTATKAKGRKPKKVLTPEEQDKLKIRELRKAALLNEPKKLPPNTWTVYFSQITAGSKNGQQSLADRAREARDSFKALSGLELERLKATAAENKLTNNANYKAWVESHTVEQISAANTARNRLRTHYKRTSKRAIPDERQPKRPVSAYLFFTKSRWGANHFTGKPVTEVARDIAAEWKGLSASERQPFDDLAAAELDRYEKEVKSAFGRDIASRSPSTSA